jgi:hypothetical protein
MAATDSGTATFVDELAELTLAGIPPAEVAVEPGAFDNYIPISDRHGIPLSPSR